MLQDRSGCPWRYLPHDFPVWQTVYYYFRLWDSDGTWEKIHYFLRAEIRVREDRNVEPSAACRYADLFEIADSQSVKVASAGIETGYDGGKKVQGRKRQILVDTLGLLLAVFVHDAHRSEQAGFKLLCEWIQDCFPRLRLIWVDSGYQGKVFYQWIKDTYGFILEVVKRKEGQKGFKVLPRRWVVERTFGWFGRYRRLSKDYEYLPTTSEIMIKVAMINLMLRRLTSPNMAITTGW